VRFLKLLASATQAGGTALAALWTFPSMLLSAFLVAWGAEAAQFLISQGLALAILAWVQTLPEFAVEAVIAWEAGGDPPRAHLAIANLTGAIRLLLGLGWPMIYFVYAFAGRRRGEPKLQPIVLQREHAAEVMGLIPPLLYFIVIVWKQSMSWIDAIVLLLLYVAYLVVLLRNPPHDVEQVEDAPRVSQWALRQRGWRQKAAIGALFATSRFPAPSRNNTASRLATSATRAGTSPCATLSRRKSESAARPASVMVGRPAAAAHDRSTRQRNAAAQDDRFCFIIGCPILSQELSSPWRNSIFG